MYQVSFVVCTRRVKVKVTITFNAKEYQRKKELSGRWRRILTKEVLKVSGKLIVNEEVFSDIAWAALHKVEDVIRQEKKGTFSGLSRLLTGKAGSKINVEKSDGDDKVETGSVSFDLRLVMVYGVSIPEVAEKVREAVIKEVKTLTGYHVARVDIVVERLIHPEDMEKDE